MGPIATRRLVHRLRRRAGGLLALAAVVAAVLACHAQPPMAGAHHDPGAMATMSACVAAVTAVGAAIAAVAVAVGLIALGRWRAVRLLAPAGLAVGADVPQAVPRAGPLLLQLLCVSRR